MESKKKDQKKTDSQKNVRLRGASLTVSLSGGQPTLQVCFTNCPPPSLRLRQLLSSSTADYLIPYESRVFKYELL
jgi:hypothetical protein